MQEEIESASVTLIVRCAEFTGRELEKIAREYTDYRKGVDREKRVNPKGKTKISALRRGENELDTLTAGDSLMKDFRKAARKYGIGYSVHRGEDDDGERRYYVCFRAKDRKILDSALAEYAGERERKTAERVKNRAGRERVSVLGKLKSEMAKAAARAGERMRAGERTGAYRKDDMPSFER